MPLDSATLGTPVEVANISKELKKLWSADQTRTRATLFNFAIVCQGGDAMRDNTDLLARFVGTHAFRALLIGFDPAAEDSKVDAWVNANCYLPKAGAKHVCSEQVSLFIHGDPRSRLPNLLFAQLDYDLPLTLWWRGTDVGHMNPEVWRWVDRLIFDSTAWPAPREPISAIRHQLGTHRTVLCDLAWTRTLHLRQSLAQMFDLPEHAAALNSLTTIRITHAPGARTVAALLLGWFSAQLGWYAHGQGASHIRFTGDKGDILCHLTEAPGATISRVVLDAGAITITAERRPETTFLHIVVAEPGRSTEHIMPADSDAIHQLLDEELAGGGRHRVYLKALAAAEPLL